MIVIVTGTGRSGTSAVARVLHESGISMGRDFAGPTPQNATGYYEDLRYWAIDDRIFVDCGLLHPTSPVERALLKMRRLINSNYRYLGPTFVSREKVLEAAEKYQPQMRELTGEIPDPGGWKATHLVWTLEAWLPCLREKPRMVVCLRSPDEVAGSTQSYFGMTDQKLRDWTIELWSNQNQRLLDVIGEHGLESTVVEYDELIGNTNATVERLSSFVGRPLDPQYVEPVLRHHKADVPERLAQMYERVKALGKPQRSTAG